MIIYVFFLFQFHNIDGFGFYIGTTRSNVNSQKSISSCMRNDYDITVSDITPLIHNTSWSACHRFSNLAASRSWQVRPYLEFRLSLDCPT